jgi:hypothetical protein
MPVPLPANAQLTPPKYAGDVMEEQSERTRLMIKNIHYPRALLAWLAAAVLAAGLLALVGANPAWAALWGFSDAQNYPVGESPFSITSADFNGDGKTDLAVANYGNPRNDPSQDFPGGVSVLLGNGDGTFQSKQDFEVATNRHPQSVTSAHFNDDGEVGNSDDFADLVVPNPASDDVSLFLSNGDGTFQDPKIFAVGDHPRHATSGDFDGNGNADLAITNAISDDDSILLGNGDGTFEDAKSFAAGDAPNSATNGDFDGNGSSDLAVLRKSSDAVSVLLGNGDGTFQSLKNLSVEDETTSLTTADLDGDNKADLATAHRPSFGSTTSPREGASVYLSNGDGTFQAAKNVPVSRADGYRRNPEQVIAVDFNGDKAQDLATSNRGAFWTGHSGVSVLLNKGDGTFQEAREFKAGINPSSLTAADVNGNNFADLAVANEGSNDLNFEKYPDDVSVLRSMHGPPHVTIDSGPQSGTDTTATFTFSSPDVGVTSFECQLDDGGYETCESPVRYTDLSDDTHVFEVRAIDAYTAFFNPDIWVWTVDNKAPRVKSVSPVNSATDVSRRTNLTAAFSEQVAQPTINQSTFKLYKCPSTTSTRCTEQITDVFVDLTRDNMGATDGRSATLNPYGNSSTVLAPRTRYKAIVTTGVTDWVGNALDQNTSKAGSQQKVWYFTTR